MLNSAIIQRDYNRLYREVRKYIWDFEAVEALADLEVAVYQLCPDLDIIYDKFNVFRRFIRDIELMDDDLNKAADRFEDLITTEDEPYANLYQTREVVQV